MERVILSKEQGLTSLEAQNLLAQHGFNELPSSKKKSLWSLLWSIVREPMVLLLIAGASIYIFIGEIHDSLLLLGSVFVVVMIAVYQERRSTRALESLRDLSSPRALVIRDGKEQKIAAREVVPGDILLIKEGDRIAADGAVLQSTNLEVDESLLTGEFHPVLKIPDKDFVFSSTLVTSGRGQVRVRATGHTSEVGKIGKFLEVADESKTRLQQEIAQLARRFGVLALLFSFIVVLSYGFTKGNWPQGILAGIAAAMSLLPEEFPVILTIFLALGAWRLSKRKVLVRQTAATENLGAVTVLCVDKTGTLTQNQMFLRHVRTPHASHILTSDSMAKWPKEFHQLLETAVLASQKDPFDPMEKAIHRAFPLDLSERVFKRQYPLAPNMLAMSQVWGTAENSLTVAMKGAPEAVMSLCHLDSSQIAAAKIQIDEMSRQGQRILGVAKAQFNSENLPVDQMGFSFQFLGLLGFEDPLRPQVAESVQECYSAGIRVIMITGDHGGTASKIATDIGLQFSGRVLTGPELEKMDELELRVQVREVNVYARVVPSQKLRIVNALKANGEIVAMSGDGVNDAPSLKWADIGIAMGGRGTDVAREAADLVILDDDFNSIVAAIRLGRRIFTNIRNAMSFVFASHFPIAALTITPVLFGLPLIMFPAHIVFMELIIDPTCTLVFEAEEEEAQVMRRPPRNLNQPLFGYRDIFYSSLQGFAVFVIVLGLFLFSLNRGHGEEESRALAFIAFVLSNLGLIAANESIQSYLKNIYFWFVSAATLFSLLSVIYIPTLRSIFGFAIPSGSSLIIAVFSALIATAISFYLRKTSAYVSLSKDLI